LGLPKSQITSKTFLLDREIMATFTTIPTEIRNKIYKLVLVRDEAVTISSPRGIGQTALRRTLRKQKYSKAASLLMVNKQINIEAKTVFYGHNTFVVGNTHLGSI
jgi:hypothetical protein